jgi:hypothetical protein
VSFILILGEVFHNLYFNSTVTAVCSKAVCLLQHFAIKLLCHDVTMQNRNGSGIKHFVLK